MTGSDAAPAVPPPRISGFYDGVADRAELLAAAQIEGIDEELALLRIRLREQWQRKPLDMTLVLKAMEVLIRAVGARHRISKKRLDELNEAIQAVARSLGEQLMPDDEI